MSDDATFPPSARTHPAAEQEADSQPSSDCDALVIVWSAREPERVGEVALLLREDSSWILGRSPALKENEQPLYFFRQRPPGVRDAGEPQSAPPFLGGEAISRRQLAFFRTANSLFVRNIGQCEFAVNGTVVRESAIKPGDTLYLRKQLLLYCTRRPTELPALRVYPAQRVGGFGEADQDQMIGESPVMWALRERLATYARTNFHVLVIGDSGSGKELAAQAIHRLSARASRKLVADNIAAIPPGLAAALLFGNKKDFPNPGMEERVGLIGAAHASTLFLDEIGDMPEQVQPIFLRVTERHGEYFRLGEERHPQRSDFRLVGATNRPGQLRHELKRRFQRELWVPGLNQRKEDIPLLVRHILLEQARHGDFDAPRFLNDDQPRLHPRLLEQLIHHTYKTHVSEIAFLIGKAMGESDTDVLRPIGTALPLEVRAQSVEAAQARKRIPRPLPSPQQAQQALHDHGGDITRTAQALDVSRDQLNRLIRREGLVVPRSRPQRDPDRGAADSGPQSKRTRRIR